MLARLDRAIADAQRWMHDVLSTGETEYGTRARRTLAGDITELRVMSTHLPFDTSHLRWISGMIHALHDRLTVMVPLLLAVEDRLAALREADAASLTARWQPVLDAPAVSNGRQQNAGTRCGGTNSLEKATGIDNATSLINLQLYSVPGIAKAGHVSFDIAHVINHIGRDASGVIEINGECGKVVRVINTAFLRI